MDLFLAILCKKFNIHLASLGTGCVFSDLPGETNFNEENKPNFFGSSYSVVNGFTERLIHMFESNFLNLRIRIPITDNHNPRKLITKITKNEKICCIANSMTVLPDLIPIMVDLPKRKHTGTTNLTNPGVKIHNEILEMYKELVDPNFALKNFTIEEQDRILASKRSNNALDTSKYIHCILM